MINFSLLKQSIVKKHFLFAIVFFVFVLIIFGYIDKINSPPESTHLWRQSDCASLALNFYQEGMNFFKPEIHNQQAENKTSGYAVSECPFLYYTVALSYKIFGYNHYVYRVFWTLLLILGFGALYRFFSLILKSNFIAFLGSLVLITSPVIIFYGNSYLPDVPALVFCLTGWMFFAKYLKNNRKIYLYFVALFFMLGGLLKITALISFFSLSGILFLEILNVNIRKNIKYDFKEKLSAILPFLIAFVIILGWYIWAWNFSKTYDTTYFSMRTCPIWGDVCSCGGFNHSDVFEQIKNIWLPHLLNKPMQIFLLLCLVFILFNIKYADRLLLFLTSFIFLGSLSFFLIWFVAFHDHDYYFINVYILPVFVFVTGFDIIRNKYQKIYKSIYLKIIFAVLVLFSLHYTTDKQKLRYYGWMNYEKIKFEDIKNVSYLIDDLKINREDLIISIPDRTPNYSLYLLNRKGWTIFDKQSNDSISIIRNIENGAKYLFVSDFDEVIQNYSFLNSFLNEPVGIYNKLHIYRIDGNPAQYHLLPKIDTAFYIYTNTDIIKDGNTEYLASDHPQYFYNEILLRTAEESLSGLHSLKLNNTQAYGFTCRIPVIPDHIITVKVQKKTNTIAGYLCVAAIDGSDFFRSKKEGSLDSDSSWELLELNILTNEIPDLDSIVIYVSNEKEQDVFFDNLEICIKQIEYEIVKNKGYKNIYE